MARLNRMQAFVRPSECPGKSITKNETIIQEALSRLIKNKTVLIIAHRMRTVSGADKIVVLKEGRVAEEGSPNELIKRDGIYAHMIKMQTESQKWTLKGRKKQIKEGKRVC